MLTAKSLELVVALIKMVSLSGDDPELLEKAMALEQLRREVQAALQVEAEA